jgi:tryptophan synthase beta chain
LKDTGRALYVSITDAEAVEGLRVLSRLEGIIPALETSHAVAWVVKDKDRWKPNDAVLICISGRGDKDLAQITEMGLLPE